MEKLKAELGTEKVMGIGLHGDGIPCNYDRTESVFALSLTLFVSTTVWSAETAKLQVHIVPHSHDDPGWFKTVDQYYSGANSSIYTASVQYIFDSVVTELLKDKNRRYTFCEISFFARWYVNRLSIVNFYFYNVNVVFLKRA